MKWAIIEIDQVYIINTQFLDRNIIQSTRVSPARATRVDCYYAGFGAQTTKLLKLAITTDTEKRTQTSPLHSFL